jgi:hypothetical protein
VPNCAVPIQPRACLCRLYAGGLVTAASLQTATARAFLPRPGRSPSRELASASHARSRRATWRWLTFGRVMGAGQEPPSGGPAGTRSALDVRSVSAPHDGPSGPGTGPHTPPPFASFRAASGRPQRTTDAGLAHMVGRPSVALPTPWRVPGMPGFGHSRQRVHARAVCGLALGLIEGLSSRRFAGDVRCGAGRGSAGIAGGGVG